MARKQKGSAPKGDDPLISPQTVAVLIDATDRYARNLMASGAFGTRFDVGQGDARPRWRVRQSAVTAWIESRKMGGAA